VSNEPTTSAFAEFVKEVADAIPGTTQGVHANRIISDYELLRMVAGETLEVHPSTPQLFADLLDEEAPGVNGAGAAAPVALERR
jgi:hypothetical protein